MTDPNTPPAASERMTAEEEAALADKIEAIGNAQINHFSAWQSDQAIRHRKECHEAANMIRTLSARAEAAEWELAEACAKLTVICSHNCEHDGCAVPDEFFPEAEHWSNKYHDFKSRAEAAEAIKKDRNEWRRDARELTERLFAAEARAETVRATAIEEAAKTVEENVRGDMRTLTARLIRALKEKTDAVNS